MTQSNRFREDMLDLDHPSAGADRVYIAAPATAVLTVPLFDYHGLQSSAPGSIVDL